MDQTLLSNQTVLFGGCYFGAIILVAVCESLWIRRPLVSPMGQRWLGNIGITMLDVATVRAVFPAIGIGFATVVDEAGWGLLNATALPLWAVFPFAFVMLDLSQFVLHYMLHRVPILWRLHLVHHTDQDYDFSTGLRFHPLEALFTTAFSLAVIALLGAPAIIVLIYELIKVLMAVFVHANMRIPLAFERKLRYAIVTPDLHRVHHSAAIAETDTNFGGLSPWWDRAFGTYVDQPALGHEHMVIGLADYQDPKHMRLHWMLVQPFLARLSRQAQKPSLVR